jgi:hypothetical protein
MRFAPPARQAPDAENPPEIAAKQQLILAAAWLAQSSPLARGQFSDARAARKNRSRWQSGLKKTTGEIRHRRVFCVGRKAFGILVCAARNEFRVSNFKFQARILLILAAILILEFLRMRMRMTMRRIGSLSLQPFISISL